MGNFLQRHHNVKHLAYIKICLSFEYIHVCMACAHARSFVRSLTCSFSLSLSNIHIRLVFIQAAMWATWKIWMLCDNDRKKEKILPHITSKYLWNGISFCLYFDSIDFICVMCIFCYLHTELETEANMHRTLIESYGCDPPSVHFVWSQTF